MDRLACVNVVSFPLQLLLQTHSDWASFPVAVVEDDRPQALVMYLNARARRAGIRYGQRYATALALARDLRSGTVSPSQVEEGVLALTNRLQRYSPQVEPLSGMPGVFLLDAEGFDRLYLSLNEWTDALHRELRTMGIRAVVGIGFSRFGAYALAMSHRTTVICKDAAEEQARLQRVPLARLNLDADVRDRLLTLGITTVGEFLRLPGEGVRTRFGAETGVLHQLAAGKRQTPLSPSSAKEQYERSIDFDSPENDAERLVFVVKRLLDGLVMTIAGQAKSVVDVSIEMKLDDRTTRIEYIRPATPTIDAAQLLMLIYLRLHTLQFSAGIVTLRIIAETCPATSGQHQLFSSSRRDTNAANQALAQVRAECGEHSVVRARICDAHLPAARFVWEPLTEMPIGSSPQVTPMRTLVRRIYTQPLPLTSGARQQISETMSGPYVVSGGWWNGGVDRDYYFVHTNSGELCWLYYDRRRRRYFLQGQVE